MLLVILTYWVSLTNGYIIKKHIPNSIFPSYTEEPVYNISRWVNLLHLQSCAFVEVGERYCAVSTKFTTDVYGV